jgi:hypothetical protein
VVAVVVEVALVEQVVQVVVEVELLLVLLPEELEQLTQVAVVVE